jgi:hypothetical protein
MGFATAFKRIQPMYNGEPCQAKRCMVQVGDNTDYTFHNSLVGQVRQAVEVIVNTQKFYLDNEDGTGWMKLIESHRVHCTELKVEKVICHLE